MLHLFPEHALAGLLGWFESDEPGVPLAFVDLDGLIIPNRM